MIFDIPMDNKDPLKIYNIKNNETSNNKIEDIDNSIKGNATVNKRGDKAQNYNSNANRSSSRQLKKGQKVGIECLSGLLDVYIEWNIKDIHYDLDISAFMLEESGKVLGDNWFVFYGQDKSPDRAVVLRDINKGNSTRCSETIGIDLNKLDSSVNKIVLVLTINEAKERGYNFSNINNAHISVIDRENKSELLRFTLEDYYSNVTSMMLGEIYNRNNQWKFGCIGDGTAEDLGGLCRRYGVDVE